MREEGEHCIASPLRRKSRIQKSRCSNVGHNIRKLSNVHGVDGSVQTLDQDLIRARFEVGQVVDDLGRCAHRFENDAFHVVG